MILLIPLAITLIVCWIMVLLLQRAVIFSKVTFTLFIAMIVNSQTPILEGGGFMSYLIWAAILLIGCFVLCLLPRFNCSFQFFCSTVVPYFLAEILTTLVCGVIFDDYKATIQSELIIKSVCLVIAVISLITQLKIVSDRKQPTNILLVMIDRLVASFLYAVTMFIIVAVSVNNVWMFETFIMISIFVGVFLLSFILDVFTFNKIQVYIKKRNAMQSNTYAYNYYDDSNSQAEDEENPPPFNDLSLFGHIGNKAVEAWNSWHENDDDYYWDD